MYLLFKRKSLNSYWVYSDKELNQSYTFQMVSKIILKILVFIQLFVGSCSCDACDKPYPGKG